MTAQFSVMITYVRNAAAAKETVDTLVATGVRAASIQVNLTGTGEIDRLVAEFRKASFISGAVLNIDVGYHL